jgi:uncharacterized protein YaaQ
MKLLIAIVHREDAGKLADELASHKFSLTKFDSTGGILKEKNSVLLVGLESERVPEAIKVIKAHSKTREEVISSAPPVVEPGDFFISNPVEVEVGGATIFVVEAEEFQEL